MKKRSFKVLSILVIFNLLYQIGFPIAAYGLTGGPSQPEVHGFEPVGTNQMVDLFSGDFTYNIPLVDVGGYPINMAYHSGINMDQEASWVGLGWSLTPGSINRAMRGLPDDFKGEEIKTERNLKPNTTVGVDVSVDAELLGYSAERLLEKLNFGVNAGVYNNSYRGIGLKAGISAGGDFGPVNISGSIGFDSQNGSDVNLGLSYSSNIDNSTFDGKNGVGAGVENKGSLSAGINIGMGSSRGLTSLSFSGSGSAKNGSYTTEKDGKNTVLASSKARGLGLGSSLSTNIPVNYSSYSPSIGVGMNNLNLALSIAPGGELPFTQAQADFKGYYSRQWIKNKVEETPAFGYLYTQSADKSNFNNSLLDFNRELDHPYHHGIDNINLSQMTYDIFNVSGQGTGGMFRPHRSDMPIVGDPEKVNGNSWLSSDKTLLGTAGDLNSVDQVSVGVELGLGTAARYGGNAQVGGSRSVAGYWKDDYDNSLIDYVGATTHQSSDPLYENVYMMSGGEMTPVDLNLFTAQGGYEPVAVDIDPVSSVLESKGYKATNKLKNGRGVKVQTLDQAATRSTRSYSRKKRTNAIQYRTNEQASLYGFEKMNESYGDIKDGKIYKQDVDITSAPKVSGNLTESRKSHHIGEFEITRADGMTYVYGIPAYNHKQVSVAFAIGDESVDMCADDGLATYTDQEASTENESGRDNFFEKTTTPAYAHSYLLTAVLSPDYVDITGDGITLDDLGTAVKLNYVKKIESYGWRAPYASSEKVARHNEGLMSLAYDDKGSYTYGTKEVWYLHSIESKTHIAEFYTSNRNDGLGVAGESGAKDDNARLQKLDSILLFNKFDRMDTLVGWDGSDAVNIPDQPVKKVYFEYDYSLCDGVPNWVNQAASEKGKLTLKKVRFAYGNSQKAMLSPYVFSYGVNPDYNLGNVDKWGSYQDSECDLPNHRFPYTRQSDADTNAWAWNLTQIGLPSGGTIDLTYEADDYGFVMDKPAAEMFQVTGVGSSSTYDPNLGDLNSRLYDNGIQKENYYVYFKLTEQVATEQELVERYQPENGILAHKFTIYVEEKSSPEMIGGYAEIEKMGFATADKEYGYVKLKSKDLKSGWRINPITHNAINFIHQNLSEKIHDIRDDIDENNLAGTIRSLAGHANVLANFIGGKYLSLVQKNFAKICLPSKSVIRLRNPSGFKKGGGSRVSKVEMQDAWADMASSHSQTGTYGMVYDYTTANPDRGNAVYNDTISSGVATYEPQMGSEENPFKEPLYYNAYNHPKLKFLGKQEKYLEGPIGESFFPSPSVGYSRVTVKSLATASNKGSGTGHSVNEFYTAWHFPVKVEKTVLETDGVTAYSGSLTSLSKKEQLYTTQGYTVKLNDMHGKPKGVWSYKQGGKSPISGTSYKYRTNSASITGFPLPESISDSVFAANGLLQLNNTVPVMDRSGEVSNTVIGLTHDIVFDGRHTDNRTWTGTRSFNLDVYTPPGPIVIPIPTFYASYKRNRMVYKSISTTKVIQQYGILESVTARDEQSVVTTKNLLWDKETGDVLLTQTKNEFEDPLYNMKYPAHMAYDGMGPSSQNMDLQLLNVNINDGIYTRSSGDASDYFAEGDELCVYQILKGTQPTSGPCYRGSESGARAWVKGIKGSSAFIINEEGKPLHGSFALRIVRSGYTNQLGEIAASFTDKQNPLDSLTVGKMKDPTDVLQTSASEFSDEWGAYSDQYKIRKCDLDTAVTGPLVRVLNQMVGANWFDTIVSGGWADTITYNFENEPAFINTKFEALGKEHTWHLKCTNTGCPSTPSHIDSYFVYDVVLQNGISGIIKQSTRLSASSLQQYKSYNLRNKFGVLRVESGCCNTDTSYALRARYDPCNIVDSGYTQYFYLGNTPDESGGLVDQGCLFTLYWDKRPIPLDSIQAFGNAQYSPATFDATGNGTDNSFLLDVKINGQWEEMVADAGHCYPVKKCWDECEVMVGDTINPFLHAIRGKWRKKKDYVYHEDRMASYPSADGHNNTEIRTDGEFAYSPFWTFGSNRLEKNGSLSNKWVAPAEIEYISPHGNELQIVDALGRYSCEIYGYDRKLVAAVANNARHNNVAYDGFEDYDFPFYENCRKIPHWAMQQDLATLVTNPYLNMDPADNTYLQLETGIKIQNGNTYKFKVPWLDYDNSSTEGQSIIGKSGTDNFTVGLYQDGFNMRLGTTSYFQSTGLDLGTTKNFIFQAEFSSVNESAKTVDVKLSILDYDTQSELASYSITPAVSSGFLNTGDLKLLMGSYQNVVKRKPTGRFYEYEIYKNGTLSNRWVFASRGLKKYDAVGGNHATVVSDNTVSATTPLDDQLNPYTFNAFAAWPLPAVQYVPASNLKPFLSYDTAHTGRASLFVPEGIRHVSTDALYSDPDTNSYNHHELRVFRADADMNIGKFAPEAGEKFVLSAWVKRADTAYTEYPITYDSLYMKVVFENSGVSPVKVFPEGPIIEGWQRIFGTFTIPNGVDEPTNLKTMAVVGDVPGTAYGGYFDDIRIQPFNSNMKSYVYDPLTLRLTAELDENNFATFYEYDSEGRLTRIKKETERGIVTLQESRYGIVK